MSDRYQRLRRTAETFMICQFGKYIIITSLCTLVSVWIMSFKWYLQDYSKCWLYYVNFIPSLLTQGVVTYIQLLIHLRLGSKWTDTLDIQTCTITWMCVRVLHGSWSDQDALKSSLDLMIVTKNAAWSLDCRSGTALTAWFHFVPSRSCILGDYPLLGRALKAYR